MKYFSRMSRKLAHSTNMCFTVSEIPQDWQIGESSPLNKYEWVRWEWPICSLLSGTHYYPVGHTCSLAVLVNGAISCVLQVENNNGVIINNGPSTRVPYPSTFVFTGDQNDTHVGHPCTRPVYIRPVCTDPWKSYEFRVLSNECSRILIHVHNTHWTAEIRRGKKKKKKKIEITGQKYNGLPYYIGRP